MELKERIDALKSVADDAKALLGALKNLAEQDKDATDAQKSKLASLVDELDDDARKASRARRRAEIEQLTEVIEAHDVTLSIPGLSRSTRDAVRADRTARVARRGRLRAQEGTDFGGILTKAVVDELESLIKKADEEVRQKQKAAAFLHTVISVADLSLRIAGKLAM